MSDRDIETYVPLSLEIMGMFIDYAVVMIGIVILGILVFFFPISQIYDFLEIEFSNLGPVLTLAWAIKINLYIIVPIFIGHVMLKVVRHYKKTED